jgi:CyaY protein
MDEHQYTNLVEAAFRRIVSALDRMDPDDVEVDQGGGYLTLSFVGGVRCVVSTQRPIREIWMAAEATAWHFAYSESDEWVAKKTGEELFATVARLVAQKTGEAIRF